MGLGMAQCIMKAGVTLKGFDINPASLEAFTKAGGQACGTVEEAANGADLLVLMVVNAAQARSVLFDAGAVDVLAPGATIMLCSTVAPAEARALGAELQERQMQLLDAPVSGGQVGAESGTLTVMASGSPAAFERAETVLEAVSGKLMRLGDEPGIGATYKVVHQLAAGVHIVAAAELMALGVKAGCDAETLFDIVTTSAGNSWMLGNRGPRMLQEDPAVTSAVDIFVKDLGLVLQTGRDCGAPLPLASAAHQMMIAASAMGLGKEDDSQVVKAYEALTGKSVS